ncbi:hypothetical protein GGR56DRAFT_660893 [Xylariaceae sp. FL0804]|nr:hypothetical protein GGR56DRAFT_660893 [Xylariaceae sp. FL0804]
MVAFHMAVVAGFLASINALPLNINLGAYSPALVVGDGEISFGGEADVTSLMDALEGAAVDTAAGTTSAAVLDNTLDAAVGEQNAVVEDAAVEDTTDDSAADDTSNEIVVDSDLEEKAAQIASLQGIGKKEIEPRVGSEASTEKRDLEGFDRALTFAEAALTKGPMVQLGTGEGGSGVGIIVDNNAGVIARDTEAAAATTSQPRRRAKVTTMYVKRGVPAAMQGFQDVNIRAIEAASTVDLPKRQLSSDTIDAINLNVADSEGLTMTFVESAEDEAPQAQEVATV